MPKCLPTPGDICLEIPQNAGELFDVDCGQLDLALRCLEFLQDCASDHFASLNVRSEQSGWWLLRPPKGYRGRFANYVTPVLKLLGYVELEHGPRNNRVRENSKA